MLTRARWLPMVAVLALATFASAGCGSNDVPVQKSDEGADTATVDAAADDAAPADAATGDVAAPDAIVGSDVEPADVPASDLAVPDPGLTQDPGLPEDPGLSDDPGLPEDPGAPADLAAVDTSVEDPGNPPADVAPDATVDDPGAPDAGTDAPAQTDSEKITAALAVAVDGLWFMSESDYPFEIVLVRDAAQTPVTVDNVKERIASVFVQDEYGCVLAECGVEVRTVEESLDHLITPEDWWEPYQYAEAEQYKALRDILLNDVHGAQVFRIGQPDEWMGLSGTIQVFFIGASDSGDLVGVSTFVVET